MVKLFDVMDQYNLYESGMQCLEYIGDVSEVFSNKSNGRMTSCNWNSDGSNHSQMSPGKSCTSPELKSENKRGRPKATAITSLILEGSVSASAIKCTFCNRVFPREKSLQAHLRTHTGEQFFFNDSIQYFNIIPKTIYITFLMLVHFKQTCYVSLYNILKFC